MVLYASLVAVYDVIWGEYWHLMFSIFNGTILSYAILHLIGWRHFAKTLRVSLHPMFRQLPIIKRLEWRIQPDLVERT